MTCVFVLFVLFVLCCPFCPFFFSHAPTDAFFSYLALFILLMSGWIDVWTGAGDGVRIAVGALGSRTL